MRTEEFVDMAVAGLDPDRVELTSMEPAEFASQVVGALSQIIAELAGNASSFSGPTQRVVIEGGFVDGHYRISVSDQGVGISESMLAALNRVLKSPPATSGGGLSLGIAVVARLAARHGIEVELVPNSPGTKAVVRIPADLVSPGQTVADEAPERPQSSTSFVPPEGLSVDAYIDELEEAEATARYERDYKSDPGHVVSMTESARAEAEDFLESVFGPLRRGGATKQRPPATPRSGGDDRPVGIESRPSSEPEPRSTRADLEIRVPGSNFNISEDESSVVSSEAAIDIKSALTRFEKGRKDASERADS